MEVSKMKKGNWIRLAPKSDSRKKEKSYRKKEH